jgi:hypothetical protein
MAISLVGSPLTGAVINGGDVTLTLPVDIEEGDVVVVFGGHPHRVGAPLGPSTSGYEEAFDPFDTQSPNFGAWYKVMGASPDANVVLQGTANVEDMVGYCGWVLRGADVSQILDTLAVTVGPTTSTNPNPPTITTVTGRAWVLAMAISTATDGSPGTPTNYDNVTFTSGAIDTVNVSVAGATIVKDTAGAEDPPAFPSWSSGTWYAATLAIRPFVEEVPGFDGGEGVLTDAAGPLSGVTFSNGGGGVLTEVA